MYNFQDFDYLARNNDHPSDKALTTVKDLLAGPMKQLEGIDVEITHLTSLILELQEKRMEIEKSVGRYRCILSPIRRVPSDILFTIFRHCQPTHRNPTMSASEAPMLLTRVCSRWRSIALASPRLWARIHIPFRIESEISSGHPAYPGIPLKKVSDTLQRRCHAAREWLLRSGDCPLSISIYYTNSSRPFSEPLDKSTTLLLKTIILFSSRWRTLELNIPPEVYIELETMLSAFILLKLVQLRLSVYLRSPPSSRTQPLNQLLKSPNLKRIAVALPETDDGFCRIFDAKLLPQWQNVTHLSIHSFCSILDLITLLKLCPQLVHFGFILTNEAAFEIRETIHLPRLMSLWVTEASSSSSVMDTLYDCIRAPDLRWIQYQKDGNPIYAVHDANNNYRGPSVLPLIERAIGIRVLEIDRFCFSPDTLRRILEVPSTTFYLNCLHLNSTHAYVGARCEDPFDLNDLIVKDTSDPSVKLTLLPRLEIFELHTTRVSDETVLKFVASRMDAQSGVCVLKKVTIVFDRLKKQDGPDIEEEIHKSAAAAGIEIQLDFQYPIPPPQSQGHVDPLSPSLISESYGYYDVVDSDCTWEFRDLKDDNEDGDM